MKRLIATLRQQQNEDNELVVLVLSVGKRQGGAAYVAAAKRIK